MFFKRGVFLFKRIYVEISNICNLQCSFCPELDRKKEVLSVSNFEKIILQISSLTEEVCLHLMGEPLIHPELSAILDVCDQYNVKVQLTTNGVIISNKAEILLNSKCLRQINFSIQSYKDNFPEKSLINYFLPIIEFTKNLQRKSPDIYVNFRLWNVGKDSIENDVIFDIVEKSFAVKLNRKLQVDLIKSKKVLNRLYLHFDSRFDWPNLKRPYQGKKGRCHALTGHFGIHADGTVVPCCLDKDAQIPLGNCLNEDINDILNSKRAILMRKGFGRGELVEELCQHCSYIKRFK